MITAPIYLFILIELLAVSYLDVKTKKISNYWSIINLVLFVVFSIFLGDIYNVSVQTFFFPIVFLVVGYILFLVKIMGAGDSKYLFSLFLIIPHVHHEDFFVCIAYTTVLVGLSVLIKNIISNRQLLLTFFKYGDPSLIKKIFGKKFSFAPVILFSWIWFGWFFWRNYVNN